ncbi:MAG: YARHG domain-containing protein [Clostridia bacterium]|nr:YARHG domain-containing protein [Clostridia bacterium]
MKKWLGWILIGSLILGCTLLPAVAGMESMYIIPDSDSRLLTYQELWEYKYDTLLYAFNEIYARHGYKFETGSRCYNWFMQMPWYSPNMNESSSDHHTTYAQVTTLEQKNVDLIKEVRAEMRAMNTTNPKGKGLPTPPDTQVDKPRGFSYVQLKAGQKLPVYAAPSTRAYRANSGKAMCSTNGAVYAMGWDNGWMLMLYEASSAGQYRVGYVDGSAIKGTLPALDQLVWDGSVCEVLTATTLTDDPALTGKSLTRLAAGTRVTYLTSMFNSTEWDYIETIVEGKTARGFVPYGTLSITETDADEFEEGNG